MKGKLYLLPTIIADNTQQAVIPESVINRIKSLTHFLCENQRTARRFVSSLKVHSNIEELQFEVLDKDTKRESLPGLMLPLNQGIDLGVLSESGCPGVADPGALAVEYAHQNMIQVVPMVGPSSILLALMGSGLNGQRFTFHGYLPVDAAKASSVIKTLEKESREFHQTQIFIETPYRNNSVLGHLIRTLNPDTTLCVAIDLTSPGEKIISRRISEWKKELINLDKAPAVFLFLANR